MADQNPKRKKSPPGKRSPRIETCGRVVKLLGPGRGYIKLIGEVPEEYRGYKDIYFESVRVQCGEMDICVNDTLTFNISFSKKRENELFAYNPRLVKCWRRSPVGVHQYVVKVTEKVKAMENTDSELLLSVLGCDAVWKAIGHCPEIPNDTISMLLDFIELLRLKSTSLLQNFSQMLEIFVNTDFCTAQKSCFRLFVDDAWQANDEVCKDKVKQFLLTVLDHLPAKARLVAAMVKPMIPRDKGTTKHFLYALIKKISTMNIEDISEFEWDELPLVPSADELISDPLASYGNMNPAKKQGQYDSVEEYMDTYFRLLRGDCFHALRKGVQAYLRSELDPRDMNIYTEISLVNTKLTDRGSGMTLGLKVKPQKKITNWEKCTNLQFGNLLCLSASGSFRDPIWATVKDRDPKLLKSDSIIWVELCSVCNNKDDSACITSLMEAKGRTVMAESPSYYIAYQPVLKALQNSNPETLSFQEELVHLQPPSPPGYLNQLSALEAPKTMDKSQSQAFTQALSNRIGIIQGPPGTGKTYIGIEMVKQLLEEEDIKFPILVLTYKNHALDEFLKDVLKFLPDGVARIGGRSQDPDIEQCNLHNLRKDLPKGQQRSAANYKQKQNLLFASDQLKGTLKGLLKQLQAVTQFSLETLLTEFDTLQVKNLLVESKVYDTSTKKKHLVGKSQLQTLWDKNEDILARRDISAKQKLVEIDGDLVGFLQQALKSWFPGDDAFKELMRGGERISQLIAAQNEKQTEKNGTTDESDSLYDESDIEDEQQERLAAIWIPQGNQDEEVTVAFTENGNGIPYSGKTAQILAQDIPRVALKKIPDLCSLRDYDKALIIQVVLWHQKDEVERELKVAMENYKRTLAAIQELDDQFTVSILQNKQVVGMTITGASIHHNLLQSLKPAIVIVEEAAEVLEPQLIAVLGNWVQHLILIGDHKQLRPSVECFELAEDYHLDVSMMERLINNNYPYSTLQMQNRMLPEMAELLKDIYPDLQSNLSRVMKNKPPNFIPPTFFWAHEDEETHERSYSNQKEAERVVRLALLFLQQGYEMSQISVLAAYQGQVKVLRQLLAMAQTTFPNLFKSDQETGTKASKGTGKPATIKVNTIDMFQGDENDIVIVSLVRSNTRGQIGFLKTINRRCVAQSRAKCGMYLVGNMATLLRAKGSCWLQFIKKMNLKKRVGLGIPLHCIYHETSKVEAINAEDIPLAGLCKKKCEQVMECKYGHPCTKPCQPFHKHTSVHCQVVIKFLHAKCKHPAQRKCHQAESSIPCKQPCPLMMHCGIHPCPSNCQPDHPHLAQFCVVPVDYTFKRCGHVMKNKRCGEDETKLRCEAKVPCKFPKCTHTGTRKCWESDDQVRCKERCTRTLSCRHPCEGYCGDTCDASKCNICRQKREIEKKKQREAEERIREEARQKAKKELEEFNKNNPKLVEECHRCELSRYGDSASEFFDVHDLVQKYVQPGHNWFPNVTKIEKVTNLKLQKEWLEAKTRMFDPTRSAMKFHGTDDDGVKGITKNGFRLPEKPGMFGAGVYFATDSSKSAQKMYTKGSNKLLLCDVLLGRSLTVEKARNNMTLRELRSKAYDSLYARRETEDQGGVRYDEFVVYNPAQALPRYIIHYEQCSLDKMNMSMPVPSAFQKRTLLPKRQFDLKNHDDLLFRLAESQVLRLQTRHQIADAVKSIDYYQNPDLIKKYKVKEKDFRARYGGSEEARPILAFHGTKAGNIESIMKTNFAMSKYASGTGAGYYGAGMYFSEFPNVSMGYATGTNKLILCYLLPGRSYKCPGLMMDAPLKAGHDSHIVGTDIKGRGQELVIFNPDQILPTFVINFE